MIDAIKSFFQVQEEDPTIQPPLDVLVYSIQKVEETCGSGVPLPEP